MFVCKKDNICDKCMTCYWYWENQDDEYLDCEGEEEPCLEYIEQH